MLGGQQAWHDHAAAVQRRWAIIQQHVTPDWLYALCSSCGWSWEPDSLDLPAFRYAVATHDCSHQEEISLVAAAPNDELVLF
jgi:hypothetical protein